MDKPKGPKDLYCPFWKKSMANVCHTCPLWTMVERTVEGYKEKHWSCALAFLVPVATEMLQETSSCNIEMNKLRNVVVNTGTGLMQLARRGQDMKQLEDGTEDKAV